MKGLLPSGVCEEATLMIPREQYEECLGDSRGVGALQSLVWGHVRCQL